MSNTFSGCWHSPAHSQGECPNWLDDASSPFVGTERICGRDHCTPEERAVINAAVAVRTEGNQHEFDHTDEVLSLAVDALLAVRSESNIQYPVRDEK